MERVIDPSAVTNTEATSEPHTLEFEFGFDTYSNGDPLDIVDIPGTRRTQREEAAVALAAGLHTAGLQHGVKAVLHESWQQGLLGVQHTTSLQIGSIDLPRPTLEKDFWEIRKDLGRNPAYPLNEPVDLRRGLKRTGKSLQRMFLGAAPSISFDWVVERGIKQLERPDGRKLLRADASHFIFEGSERPMLDLLARHEDAELVIESFGVIKGGFHLWQDVVEGLRDTLGDRVKFSIDYSHVDQNNAIEEFMDPDDPERMANVLTAIVRRYGKDSIGAFEWNFMAPNGVDTHATPNPDIIRLVQNTEQAAAELGVGADFAVPRIIEAGRGKLRDSQEIREWVELGGHAMKTCVETLAHAA